MSSARKNIRAHKKSVGAQVTPASTGPSKTINPFATFQESL